MVGGLGKVVVTHKGDMPLGLIPFASGALPAWTRRRARPRIPLMSDSDFSGAGSRLTSRVRRYARVGTSVGGLAAQLAGARLFGFGLDRARHSSELKAALGGLKGPLMKVAQILATIPDALPPEYAEGMGNRDRRPAFLVPRGLPSAESAIRVGDGSRGDPCL